ncbi:tape measure protein [Ottowia sp.]|uniref:tape measure protein n=1 Tax=Ottowia sp. TaxID=1898956 RepID=UPI003A8A40D4
MRAKLVVEADATGGDKLRKLATELDRMGREGGEAMPELAALAKAMHQLGSAADRSEKAASKANRALSLLGKGALAGLGFAGAQLGINSVSSALGVLRDGIDQVVRAGAKFESLQNQLEVLYGSAGKAEQALGWITDFAKTTPFELDTITESFAKLKAMGLDPMDGSFAAIADQAAALGGEGETLNGIVLALGQAWTKQKLQGEEALQLIERGVPVWDLLAQATGKSVRALQEMSSAGQLGRDALRQLMDEMGRTNAGARAKALETWNGQMGLLRANWQSFLDLVAKSGVLDLFRAELTAVNNAIEEMSQTGELKVWAQQASDAIVKLYQGIKELGASAVTVAGYVNKYSAELEALAKVAVGLKALGLGKTLLGWGTDALLGAQHAQAAAGIIGKAGQVAAAGWLGWSVGTYLKQEFVEIEQAGIALAAGLTKTAAYAKAAVELAQAAFSDDTAAAVQQRLAQQLQAIDDSYADLFASAGKASEAQQQQAAASDDAAAAAQRQADANKANAKSLDDVALSAEQLAKASDQALTEAFDRLGVNAAQAMGRVSESAQVAIDTLDNVADQLGKAGLKAEDSARAMEVAFAAAVPKADSLESIDALQKRLDAMGKSGQLGADGMQRLNTILERQRQTVEGQIPGIQRLEEALHSLGVTPQKELDAAAAAAKQAFDTVQGSGTATAQELNQAWRSMAETQIAANDGVADAMLQAQAGQRGFVIETDEAGKSVVRSMEESKQATESVGDAAKETGRKTKQAQKEMADGQGDVDAALDKTAKKHGELQQAVTFTWMSATTQASKYRDEAARHADELEGKWQSLNGQIVNSWAGYYRAWNTHFVTLRTLAEEYAKSLERVDAEQQALERSGSGTAKGVEDLRMRLLELKEGLQKSAP